MKTLFCLILLFAFVVGSEAQKENTSTTPSIRRLFETDKLPPPFCEIYLVSATTAKGSLPYMRLAYIAEALNSAQSATEAIQKEVEDVKASNSLTELFQIQTEATHEAVDRLHCAADIAHVYTPTDANDKKATFILMVAFNQEAQAIADLAASEKRRFTRAIPIATDPKIVAKDAEELAKISDSQRDAASTISEATTLSLYEVMEATNNADSLPYLVITCSERADLLHRVELTASGIKTAYSQDAGLIKAVLTTHQCRQISLITPPASPSSASPNLSSPPIPDSAHSPASEIPARHAYFARPSSPNN